MSDVRQDDKEDRSVQLDHSDKTEEKQANPPAPTSVRRTKPEFVDRLLNAINRRQTNRKDRAKARKMWYDLLYGFNLMYANDR